MFLIGFTDEPMEYPFDDPLIPAAPGRLVLGESEEQFLANLSLWDKSDYQFHWRRELKALVEGNSKVAIIVSYDDPNAASNMEIWLVYRDGDWAHFQNQLLWYSSLPEGFVVAEMSRYISDRVVTTEERHRISEWDVPVRDIESFLRDSGGI